MGLIINKKINFPGGLDLEEFYETPWISLRKSKIVLRH